MKFKNNAVQQIKDLMIEKNNSSGALFQGLVFGNAFQNEEIFIGVGEAQEGGGQAPQGFQAEGVEVPGGDRSA
jgi:hypothetical protein